MTFDRIEATYNAIDEMAKKHKMPRPQKFGGGKWNKDEELAIYVEQVGKRYTPLQWKIILSYAQNVKKFDITEAERSIKKIK